MRIKRRDGTMAEVADGYILAHGEAMVVGLMMMDSGRTMITDGRGHVAGSRPGFLYADNDVAHAVRMTAYQMYADAVSNRWRGDRWQSGPSKAAAPTTFATGDAAVAASYEQYRHDISNRWKSR